MSILEQRASDVRTREIDLSQVVTGASTSVAAVTIVSNKGSLEKQRFTDGQDFRDTFVAKGSNVTGFDVQCTTDFFREGQEVWAQRVAGAGYKYAAAVVYDDNGVTKAQKVPGGVADPHNVDLATLAPANTTPFLLVWPKDGPGSFGDALAFDIVSANAGAPEQSGISVTSEDSGGTLNPAKYTYRIASIVTEGETMPSAEFSVEIAGQSVVNKTIIKWKDVPGAIGYRIYGRTDNGMGLLAEVGVGTEEFVDTGAIPIDTSKTPITNPADAAPTDPSFVFRCYDTNVSTVNYLEAFPCTLEPGTDGDGLATEIEERVNPFSSILEVRNDVLLLASTPDVGAVALTNLEGGDSGAAPTAFDIIKAWESFEDKELYQINLLLNTGHSVPVIQHAMDALAQKREDSVALLDTPSAQQKWQDAINYRNLQLNLNSSYSALFCPDVEEADTLNSRIRFVPFSGWAGALCARTDRVANPSYSIAGLNRGIVPVLRTRHTYTDPQASAMFRAQVNYTRTFIGQGIALWEQKTLQAKDSALSWLNVRRIVNVIKTALYRYGLYVLQEPNDDFSGQTIVTSFSDYLELIKNARGIKRYTVISDSSNNPDALYNSGIRRVTVIIVPMIAIHELQLDIAISKEGVQFSETLRTLYGA